VENIIIQTILILHGIFTWKFQAV